MKIQSIKGHTVEGSYIKPAMTGAVHQRQDMRSGDSKNCTVRALANCADIQYDIAHEAMLKAGRKLNEGADCQVYLPVYQKFGAKKVQAVGNCKQSKYWTYAHRKMTGEYPELVKGMTVATMLSKPEYQRGVFAVEIIGHIFCVRNGLIMDTGYNKMHSRVQAIIWF